jgi:hypothetical protein
MQGQALSEGTLPVLSYPCTVPSTDSNRATEAEPAQSRPTTQRTAVPGAFLLLDLSANLPRNLLADDGLSG